MAVRTVFGAAEFGGKATLAEVCLSITKIYIKYGTRTGF